MKTYVKSLTAFAFITLFSRLAGQASAQGYATVQDCINAGVESAVCNALQAAQNAGSAAAGGDPGGITNPAIGNLGASPGAARSGVLFAQYFISIWQTLTVVGGIALLLYLIWGAIDWLVAGGDSGKVQKARDKMTNAVIGFIILIGSYSIVGFIGSLIGYNLLTFSFPTPGGQ